MQALSGAKAFFEIDTHATNAHESPYPAEMSSQEWEDPVVSDYAGYPSIIESHLAEQRAKALAAGVIAMRQAAA